MSTRSSICYEVVRDPETEEFIWGLHIFRDVLYDYVGVEIWGEEGCPAVEIPFPLWAKMVDEIKGYTDWKALANERPHPWDPEFE